MSEQQENPEVDEALEAVKEALSPKKFNIVDAIQGKAYPTDEIVVYLDEVNIRKLRDLNKELTRLNNAAATDTERYKIGRASCRERVELSEVVGALKENRV